MTAILSPVTIATASNAIRRARPGDAPALSRLLARAGAAAQIAALFASGHLLVLDGAAGELGAAAHVELGATAHLDLLVVDPELHGRRLEARILGVAEAYCEAWGCRDMDVAAPGLT